MTQDHKACFSALSLFVCCWVAFSACNKKPAEQTGFTKVDSLTETYLVLQDTMLRAWNTMIHDDNRKIKAMQHLLHELRRTNPEKTDELDGYADRVEHLVGMRYDQHSMSDAERITEYDFVSNSLVSELIALAESQKEFAYNTTLQKLADSIRAADQRVNTYREEYDLVALRFNRFIVRNKDFLKEIDDDSFLEEKALFQMAAE